MINVSLKTNPELYKDYKEGLKLLRNVKMGDYTYPKDKTIIHTYTEVKNDKHIMVIKSYLATQNLSNTELWVWCDYDISAHPLVKQYNDYIKIKVYDAFKEAKDTLLEDKTDYLTSNDGNYWMKSGILRFLVTHKYGGIWVDADVILFRDLKPIMDQEWAGMWGSELDFANYGPCAAYMSFKKRSPLSTICMEEIIKTKIEPMTTCFDKDLLAEVYQRQEFTVFPSTFFDAEWQINVHYDENGVKQYNPEGLGTYIERQWFANPLENMEWLFSESFMWHYHFTSHKNEQVHPKSKFAIWQTIIDSKLKEKIK